MLVREAATRSEDPTVVELPVELSRQARQRLKWFKEGEQRTALLSVFRLCNQEAETKGKP